MGTPHLLVGAAGRPGVLSRLPKLYRPTSITTGTRMGDVKASLSILPCPVKGLALAAGAGSECVEEIWL